MSSMNIDKSTLPTIPLSLATVSIGYSPTHTLPVKLSAIASAGFTGIELGFPDLISFANQHLGKEVGAYGYDDLVTAAGAVKELTDKHGLEVMLLQPFANFEGWKDGSKERDDAFTRLKGWIRCMEAVGCKTLQVGSTDTPSDKGGWSGSFDDIVKDLQLLADELAKHGFRVAYENWCWSTYAPDWKDVWKICQAVDRGNFGLCLDTFQSAGGEWADPTTESGTVGNEDEESLGKKFKESMQELARTVPADRIYLLQISDAYKVKPPLPDKVNEQGMRPRAVWSGAYRPVCFAEGAYLPVVDMARGVLGTGFRGWFSVEVFDSGPDGKGKEYDLEEFAHACASTTRELIERCGS